MPAADLDLLCDILMKVGVIGMENELIQEIDINPLILSGDKPWRSMLWSFSSRAD